MIVMSSSRLAYYGPHPSPCVYQISVYDWARDCVYFYVEGGVMLVFLLCIYIFSMLRHLPCSTRSLFTLLQQRIFGSFLTCSVSSYALQLIRFLQSQEIVPCLPRQIHEGTCNHVFPCNHVSSYISSNMGRTVDLSLQLSSFTLVRFILCVLLCLHFFLFRRSG